MTNEYGLDYHYFEKKLKTIHRDVKTYTPDEMFNALSRLMMVAASQAGMSATVKVKFLKGGK